MIRRRRSLLLAAAPLACLFLSITLQASQEVATISGVVADASGTPIPGAIVTMSGDGIIGGMDLIVIKADRTGHFTGQRVDRDLDAQ